MLPRTFAPAARPVIGALILALSGCAAMQAPDVMVPKGEDIEYGYVETKTAEREYQITYYGPQIYTELTVRSWLDEISATAQKTSHDLALWRAAQIAAAKGCKAFRVTGDREAVQHYIVGRDYETVPVSTFEDTTIRKLEYWSATYFRGEVSLDVALLDEVGPDSYDAAATATALQAQYADALSRPIMANTQYYFGPSSWLFGYKEGYKEAPLFESSPSAPKPVERKPLGQPYYSP